MPFGCFPIVRYLPTLIREDHVFRAQGGPILLKGPVRARLHSPEDAGAFYICVRVLNRQRHTFRVIMSLETHNDLVVGFQNLK